MEQGMSYHSDNEPGVQATIAAVSLGAPAVISFRQRARKGQKERKKCLEITLVHVSIIPLPHD
jgi:alkylated DNA repair dioxygenase AlkB